MILTLFFVVWHVGPCVRGTNFVSQQWRAAWQGCSQATDIVHHYLDVIFGRVTCQPRVRVTDIVGQQTMPYFWLMSADTSRHCQPIMSVPLTCQPTKVKIMRRCRRTMSVAWRHPHHTPHHCWSTLSVAKMTNRHCRATMTGRVAQSKKTYILKE